MDLFLVRESIVSVSVSRFGFINFYIFCCYFSAIYSSNALTHGWSINTSANKICHSAHEQSKITAPPNQMQTNTLSPTAGRHMRLRLL